MIKPSRRVVAFWLLCATAALIAAIYVIRARGQLDPQTGLRKVPSGSAPEVAPTAAATQPSGGTASERAERSVPAVGAAPSPAAKANIEKAAPDSGLPDPRRVLFRSTALDDTFGRLGVVPFGDPAGARTFTALRCERVHFAAGRGVCLVAERRAVTTFAAVVFDGDFRAQHQIPLAGIPSRVRIAPNGRVAAITVFVSGHGYSSPGFSTLTTFVNLQSGELMVDNMEKFRVWRNGERFQEVDFNFWGVTFARDSDRFYATLASRGRTHLIEGELSKMEARVLRDDVECPSLSPDNRRIGFKKRFGGRLTPVGWRLSVLDVKTLEERPLGESRSVDDQVEWADNDTVIYSLPEAESSTAVTNVWAVAAQGTGEARRLLSGAYSPVVLPK